jgi:hypothetical protein
LALSGLNLTFKIENPNYDTSNTYVTFIDGTLDATYGGGTRLNVNQSYTISQLGNSVNLVSYIGGRVFVSLGAGVANPPEPVNSNIPSYHVRHDKFELTYSATNSASCADLTSVDFFSLPLEINTYHSGSTTPVDTLTYRISADALKTELAALAGDSSNVLLTDANGFLRVLSPRTTTVTQIQYYPPIQPYIDAVKVWQGQGHAYTTIEDLYSHLGSTPATQTQNYSFQATIEADGSLKMVGGGDLVGQGHTILVAAANMAQGIYLGNVAWTVDGQADSFANNDVYGAAVRDVLAGFNLGFMASETIDPNTGTAFGAESSKLWWRSTRAFEYLQPSHTYYNQYAKVIADNSDSYGYPFSDRWSHVLANLSGIDTLEIVVLADSVSATTPGLYDASASTFYLRNSNTSGTSDTTFGYGSPGSGWTPLVGDWNGVGHQTVGLYDPTSSGFYLKNANTSGYADTTFGYGSPGAGWTPLVGDWNGVDHQSVGLYDPASSTFYLKNANTTGIADTTFGYGQAGAGWTPLVGDWDGDGHQTVGLYDPATSTFYLKNANTAGSADITFGYGSAGAGLTPLVGDWNGDGRETVGLYDPASSTFYLKNANSSGYADVTFGYGAPGAGWKPLAGNWTGAAALLAAEGAVAASDASILTQADLQPIVNEAIARWVAAGLDDATVARLQRVEVTIGDLSGSLLGQAGADRICLDRDAAGHGWFVDLTPARDEEFARSGSSRQLTALDPRAVDRIDLLSVVEHELGHIAGYEDLDAQSDRLMAGVLGSGVRARL